MGLRVDGLDWGSKKLSQIIAGARRGLVIIPRDPVKLHITSRAATVEQAVSKYRYGTCFMDGQLIGGSTFAIVKRLVTDPYGSTVYCTSEALKMVGLEELFGSGIDKAVQAGRLVVCSEKNYQVNRSAAIACLAL
jgi:hypothetical protein